MIQHQVSDTTVWAWRGERIGLEALVVAPEATAPLRVEMGKWTDEKGKKVDMPYSYAAWMRSQIATHHQACGYPDPNLPTYTIADMIDLPGSEVAFEGKHVRPIVVQRGDSSQSQARSLLHLATPDAGWQGDSEDKTECAGKLA